MHTAYTMHYLNWSVLSSFSQYLSFFLFHDHDFFLKDFIVNKIIQCIYVCKLLYLNYANQCDNPVFNLAPWHRLLLYDCIVFRSTSAKWKNANQTAFFLKFSVIERLLVTFQKVGQLTQEPVTVGFSFGLHLWENNCCTIHTLKLLNKYTDIFKRWKTSLWADLYWAWWQGHMIIAIWSDGNIKNSIQTH